MKFMLIALFTVCVALNISYTQEGQTANITFELNPVKLFYYEGIRMIEIEIMDNYRPWEGPKKLQISFGINSRAENYSAQIN